jgi:hypothetical protein
VPNPFYSYSSAFIPGTLARAEQLAAEFSSVQSGFAILAIQGTDSGSANTYVVTTNGGPSAAYADGNIVEFKAAAANTGASTINVNGIGVVSLTASGGASLQSGSIVANTWYRAIYNSTYSAFTLIAPISTTSFSGIISSAAPTNKVGLVAAGGLSTNAVPIDATYAIDLTIAPTWTGVHTFANAVAFNSAVTFATGLSLTGAANAYALTLTGNSTVGQSKGLLINAGTNASDFAALINSQSGGTAFFTINGQGSVTVGSPAGGAQGVGTINAVGLYVGGVAVSSAVGANPTASVGLSAVNGVATTYLRSDGAPALSQAIAPTWTAAHIHTPSSAVTAVTINVPANATGFIINGGTNTGNNYLAQLLAGLGSGFSSGVLIQAGTTSADSAILIKNSANTVSYFQVRGDGKILGGGPVAAALVDMTPDTGSFTITYTGFTANPTGTAVWTRVGNLVTLFLPTGTGTSNANTFTATGLPSAIQPARTQTVAVPAYQLEDATANVVNPAANFSAGSGTVTFWKNGNPTCTNSGAKGVLAPFTVSYLLN